MSSSSLLQSLAFNKIVSLNSENNDEIKSSLNIIETDVKSIETDVKSIETDVKSIETDVKSIETDVKSIETDVKSIETDVSTLTNPAGYGYIAKNIPILHTLPTITDIDDKAVTSAYLTYLGRIPTSKELSDGKILVENNRINDLEIQLAKQSMPSRNLNPIDDSADLSGKSVVIIGASSGQGFETALLLASKGAEVYCCARTNVLYNINIEASKTKSREDALSINPIYMGSINFKNESNINFTSVDIRNKSSVKIWINSIKSKIEKNLYAVLFFAGVYASQKSISDSYYSLNDSVNHNPTRFIPGKSSYEGATYPAINSVNCSTWGYYFVLDEIIPILKNSENANKFLTFTVSTLATATFVQHNGYTSSKSNVFQHMFLKYYNEFQTINTPENTVNVIGISPTLMFTDFQLSITTSPINIKWNEVTTTQNSLKLNDNDITVNPAASFIDPNNYDGKLNMIKKYFPVVMRDVLNIYKSGTKLNIPGYHVHFSALLYSHILNSLNSFKVKNGTHYIMSMPTPGYSFGVIDPVPKPFDYGKYDITETQWNNLMDDRNQINLRQAEISEYTALYSGHYPGNVSPNGLKIISI